SGDVASATGSSNQGRFAMSNGRGRERERAETPVIATRPPAGAKSGRSSRNLSSPAPTVPRPATPTRQVFCAVIWPASAPFSNRGDRRDSQRLGRSWTARRISALSAVPLARRSRARREGGGPLLRRQGVVGAAQDLVGIGQELL